MPRGRLVPPNLDDRTWQDIVDETRALIPKYAPEWTDHNPSDLGIALIELFAWLVEGMIYRLNRVPEKNYIAFLNLLGITRDPATPASTLLTYTAVSDTPVEVPQGTLAATPQTETEDAIIFETDELLLVLPVNLTTALYLRDEESGFETVTAHLVGSPLSGLTIEIPATQSVMLALGFDARTTEEIRLRFRFSRPAAENDLEITWRYSQEGQVPANWPALESLNDETEAFQRNGVASFVVPGDWASQEITGVADQPRFWIGLQITNQKGEDLHIGLEHILFNSVPATNALTITTAEPLGSSNGKPFQFFELQNRPLFKHPGVRDPYQHLKILVREPPVAGVPEEFIVWERTDDFPEGPGRYFRLDAVTGTLHFGNHDPTTTLDGHGTIPPEGSEIRAETYRYVAGGAKGNVPPGTINAIRTSITGIMSVVNLGPAKGGSDEETVEETKRRAPEALRNRDRAVTVEDYEYLAREASTDVKKVRCLPPHLALDGFGDLERGIDRVNVIIIPDDDASASSGHRVPRPRPSRELLEEVHRYLESRRVVTTALYVTPPRYLPIDVTVTIVVFASALTPGQTQEQFRAGFVEQTQGKIRGFLHPLSGGPAGTGWEIGENFLSSHLLELIQPDPSVGFVSELEVKPGTPEFPNRPPDVERIVSKLWVHLADYEIICNGDHTIAVEFLD